MFRGVSGDIHISCLCFVWQVPHKKATLDNVPLDSYTFLYSISSTRKCKLIKGNGMKGRVGIILPYSEWSRVEVHRE
jgi:hypothetical protein